MSELADFSEVHFISEDREVHMTGHVEKTTGAAFMRAQSGNSGLKGKDVNIAVLDSGIDKDHHQIGRELTRNSISRARVELTIPTATAHT